MTVIRGPRRLLALVVLAISCSTSDTESAPESSSTQVLDSTTIDRVATSPSATIDSVSTSRADCNEVGQPSARPLDASILVDLRNAIIDGVDLRQTGELLEAQLGAGRVTKTTELLEGEPSDMYIIRFAGHEVCRHWNASSFTDAVFRTSEGLGVGSTIGEFEKVYGKGRVGYEEGCTIYFRTSADRQFAIPVECMEARPKTSSAFKNVVAKEIWIW